MSVISVWDNYKSKKLTKFKHNQNWRQRRGSMYVYEIVIHRQSNAISFKKRRCREGVYMRHGHIYKIAEDNLREL